MFKIKKTLSVPTVVGVAFVFASVFLVVDYSLNWFDTDPPLNESFGLPLTYLSGDPVCSPYFYLNNSLNSHQRCNFNTVNFVVDFFILPIILGVVSIYAYYRLKQGWNNEQAK